jgi:hypothetical protein
VSEYKSWRWRLTDWLDEAEDVSPVPSLVGDLAANLVRIIRHARLTAQGINETLGRGCSLRDRNPYERLWTVMDSVLEHQTYSLAEYTYVLPQNRHPGVRLFLEEQQDYHRVAVLFFEDVTMWRVDEAGRKVMYELLFLNLDQTRIFPEPPAEAQTYYKPEWTWRTCLTEAMCLPIRLMLIPSETGN